jgi:antitoxin (DNA-binding transcriptional repressor) of toxin-antitoxin stability system
MKTVNLYEAKTHLSRIVSELEHEEDCIVLCRNGVPVADILPHRASRVGLKEVDPELAGANYVGDPCATLDESDWPEALR